MVADGFQAPYFLGIDLGGTNIKAGVVDDRGRPLSAISRPTEAERGPKVGLENLADAGQRALEQSGVAWEAIEAVGIGSPGTMDLQRGTLIHPHNLPGWDNLEIARLLGERLQKSTVLQNDANAAAFGEYWAGVGAEHESLVLFTLGTGIGCGIVLHGQILEGRHSHGAECGHIIIQMDGGREWPVGFYGRLEGYASATALVKRAHEALQQEPDLDTQLRVLAARDDLTSEAIDEAWKQGDPLADRLMRQTARYLAVGAVNLMHTIDPDVVVFGGGMIASGPALLEQIRAGIREMAFPVPARETKIVYAELGGRAGFIGSAGWARQRWLADRH